MKKYSPKDFTDFAISVLERAAEENPKRIIVKWIDDNPKYYGEAYLILVRQNEIRSREDAKLQNAIAIKYFGRKKIQYYDREKGFRDIKDVISDLKDAEFGYHITGLFKVVYTINEWLLLVELFGKLFFAELHKFISKKEYDDGWIALAIRNDIFSSLVDATLYETSKKEILVMMA